MKENECWVKDLCEIIRNGFQLEILFPQADGKSTHVQKCRCIYIQLPGCRTWASWEVNMLKLNAETLKCMKWAFCTLQTDLSSLARGLISSSNIKGKTAHNIKLFPWLTLILAEFSAQQLSAMLCVCVCVSTCAWMRAREHTRGPRSDPVHSRQLDGLSEPKLWQCSCVTVWISFSVRPQWGKKNALWMMRGDSQKRTTKRLTHRLLGRFRSPRWIRQGPVGCMEYLQCIRDCDASQVASCSSSYCECMKGCSKCVAQPSNAAIAAVVLLCG